MARAEINETVQNRAGTAGVGIPVAVTVRATGLPATVYADPTSSTTLSNPVVSDDDGKLTGWLDEGSYLLSAPDAVPVPFEAVNGASQAALEAQVTALQAQVTSLQAEADALVAGLGAPNTQTGNYTLALADNGKIVEIDSTGGKVVTVPTNGSVAFPIGAVIGIRRNNSGSVTIHPASGAVIIRNRLDINGTADRFIADQWSEVSLCKRGTNEWVLVGNIA